MPQQTSIHRFAQVPFGRDFYGGCLAGDQHRQTQTLPPLWLHIWAVALRGSKIHTGWSSSHPNEPVTYCFGVFWKHSSVKCKSSIDLTVNVMGFLDVLCVPFFLNRTFFKDIGLQIKKWTIFFLKRWSPKHPIKKFEEKKTTQFDKPEVTLYTTISKTGVKK